MVCDAPVDSIGRRLFHGSLRLGFGVGYTLDAVGPIIIASIVSICWFKEITGRRQLLPLGLPAEVVPLSCEGGGYLIDDGGFQGAPP